LDETVAGRGDTASQIQDTCGIARRRCSSVWARHWNNWLPGCAVNRTAAAFVEALIA
jgi:hypothetical protein